VTQFENGAIIDAYRIVGTLGSGGMGQVYRVEHTLTRRQDAMKVLVGGRQAAGGQAQRFLREIRLQASLNHPNIAAVHHAFWMDDDLVMIMELVEGATLQSVLQTGRPLLATAFNYAKQVLVALQYAHEHGVVHRDVTPANILIAPGGSIKLTDFGLAKAPRDMRLTQSGAVMGSLYYMSPEQVRGSATLDERTDIYSLGAVLYEMSTGKRPFEAADPFSLMLAHVAQEPAPPLQIDPSLPPELSLILLAALAKEPGRRFSSANAFREALEGLPNLGSASRVRRWPRSKVMRYSASALVCATLLIGVEKPKLTVRPAAVEQRPMLRTPDIHEGSDAASVTPPATIVLKESADDGSMASRATAGREKSVRRLVLRTSDIRKESAGNGRVASRASVVHEKSPGDERPVPRSADIHKRSADDGGVAALATDVREKSGDERPESQSTGLPKKPTDDRPPHRRSWLSRAVGKIVHPRSH